MKTAQKLFSPLLRSLIPLSLSHRKPCFFYRSEFFPTRAHAALPRVILSHGVVWSEMSLSSTARLSRASCNIERVKSNMMLFSLLFSGIHYGSEVGICRMPNDFSSRSPLTSTALVCQLCLGSGKRNSSVLYSLFSPPDTVQQNSVF